MNTSTAYLLREMSRPWAVAAKVGLEIQARFHGVCADMTKGTALQSFHDHGAAVSKFWAEQLQEFGRPEFEIDQTQIGKVTVGIEIETVLEKSFCRLQHFKKINSNGSDYKSDKPKVLLFAPMSGHYATLLRNTIEELLPDHDVYITDWRNAANIPASKTFDLDDFVDYARDFMTHLGPETNVVAVCQPGPPVVAAVALMAEDNDPNQPLTLTLMGSPIKASANPTVPTELAKEKGIGFFQNLVGTVPSSLSGAGRKVHWGQNQLLGFVSMNLETHQEKHRQYFEHLVLGDEDSLIAAEKHEKFYQEYNAVMDLTGEFYLQTIESVFIDEDLANGTMKHRGRLVDPSKITKTAIMSVEGKQDDISAPLQCSWVHKLCTGLPQNKHFNILKDGVGHYGIFNGSKWRNEIVPRLTAFIRNTAYETGITYDSVTKVTGSINPTPWYIAEKRDYLEIYAQIASHNKVPAPSAVVKKLEVA